jgi:hypothetical protein
MKRKPAFIVREGSARVVAYRYTDDPAFTIENKPEQTCLGALIRVSDEFGSEEDLTWVCQELDVQGPDDPFRIIGAEFSQMHLFTNNLIEWSIGTDCKIFRRL